MFLTNSMEMYNMYSCDPALDMYLLMNLSFINILSKFNSNTFCLWCCYSDIDIMMSSSHLSSLHLYH